MLRVWRRPRRADAGADGLAGADGFDSANDHSDTIVNADGLISADDDVGFRIIGRLHGIGPVRLVAELPVQVRQRRGVHDYSKDRRIPQRRVLSHGGVRHPNDRRHGLLGRFWAGLGYCELLDKHLVVVGRR